MVGACMALGEEDYVVGNHRCYDHPIGKGADVKALMAEIYGKVNGRLIHRGGYYFGRQYCCRR